MLENDRDDRLKRLHSIRRWMQMTPVRVIAGIALVLIVAVVPITGTLWALQRIHASGPDLRGLPRLESASALLGSSTGKDAHRVRPDRAIPGRQLPTLAGHAAHRAGHNVLSTQILHSNTDLAPNVVVSSDTTAAPFGPEPRNGPQAVLDPTNPNTLLVAYNDYTPNGHGGRYTAGYSISSDNGANWSQARAIHGLLKMDGGLYDGAGDPGVAFDGNGNAYLAVTTFDDDDWATGIYVAKMPASVSTSSQFGSPIKVVCYIDAHAVVQYARLATGVAGNTNLYLTFNALGTSPQTPNSPLAATWTSQLYFTRSTDGGQTWSSPVAIGSGQQDYWGVPVVGWNNTISVFYAGSYGLQMVQSGNGGLTWTKSRSLQPMSSVGEQRGNNGVYINPGPDAAADIGSHMLYVVYDGGKVTISADDGAHWSQPMDVLGSNYAPAYLASISVDQVPYSHTVSVGGYSSANDPSGNSFNYYYALSSDGGNHFSGPILISSNVSLPPAPAFGSIGRSSSVASGGSKAHLFWTDTNGVNGNEQIMSATVDVSRPLQGALWSTWDSGQPVQPWGLVFTASGSQNIGVANYGQGGLAGIGSVNVSTSDGSWLTASVTGAPDSFTVTVTVTAGASNQSGTVTITSSSGQNNSITIPVQVLVNTSAPAFSMSGNTLSFTAQQGVDPPPQALQINSLSRNGDTLQITNSDPSLYVTTSGGPQLTTLNAGVPSGVIVQLVTAGLSGGSSNHQFTVSDGITSVTVNVNANVTAAPAQLDDPGSSLSFTYHQQDAIPQAQLLSLHNSGESVLYWQGTTDASWLSLGSTNGTLAPGSSQQVGVNVNVVGLQPGTHTGHILLGGDVQALNLPEVLTVYLVIDPPASQVSTTWYFAEGYVSANFTEFLTLANPNLSQTAHVKVTYLTQPNGKGPQAPFVLSYTVKPGTRYSLSVNNQPGIVQNDNVSLVVNSDVPIVAERPIYFRFGGLSPNPRGGTDVVGATHQGTAFFFPFTQFGQDQQVNSPTYGTAYSTFLTVLNQNNAAVNVAVTYKGASSMYTVTHPVAAHTRGTIVLANDFPLATGSSSYLYAASVLVTTDLPVVAEMPSYFTIPGGSLHGVFASGIDEIGATAPQTNWDFAEGYTGTNSNQFLTYIDLANFGDTPANATLTLGVTNGSTPLPSVVRQYTVPPQSSISVWLNPLVCPQGVPYCGYAVGTHVSSSQPVVVDRQMFFNKGGTIPGSTAAVGAPTTQGQYYFAEGYTGPGFSEFLTIVNPSTNASAETVKIQYLIQGGTPKTITLPQRLQLGQRWTESVNSDVGANQQVSVVVSTNTGTLIVERPMYFNYHGWAIGGTDVIGYSRGN